MSVLQDPTFADPYSAEDAAMRKLIREDHYALRDRYVSMTVAQQRAYAAAHPEFKLYASRVVPEHTMHLMADAEAVDGPDASRAIFEAYIRAQATANAEAIARERAMPVGERVIMSAAITVFAAPVALIACLTGAVAAGLHGAAVAGTFIGLTTTVLVLVRLLRSGR